MYEISHFGLLVNLIILCHWYSSFFQIKVDIPPECRIYPIDSEDEEEESPGAAQGGVKEIICPWETVTKHDGAR